MSGFQDARFDIFAKLNAAGIPTGIDPGMLPPIVLVGVPAVVIGGGIGGWTTEIPVRILAAPPGNAEALVWMCDTLEAVLRTLGPATADYGTYDLVGKSVPAYTVTYRVDVPNPDC